MARTYNVNERNLQDMPDRLRGIYIMGIFDGISITPFNVGSSEDIKKRLKEHLSDSETNSCIRQKVKEGAGKIYFYYEVLNVKDLTIRENQLFEELTKLGFKLCNKQAPKA